MQRDSLQEQTNELVKPSCLISKSGRELQLQLHSSFSKGPLHKISGCLDLSHTASSDMGL